MIARVGSAAQVIMGEEKAIAEELARVIMQFPDRPLLKITELPRAGDWRKFKVERWSNTMNDAQTTHLEKNLSSIREYQARTTRTALVLIAACIFGIGSLVVLILMAR